MRQPLNNRIAGLTAAAALAAAGASAAPRLREPAVTRAAPGASASRASGSAAAATERITAELTDLTLSEAAAKLSQLLGVPVSVPDREKQAKPGAAGPRLDYERRARFSWTAVPVSDALREFCRKYECSLL